MKKFRIPAQNGTRLSHSDKISKLTPLYNKIVIKIIKIKKVIL